MTALLRGEDKVAERHESSSGTRTKTETQFRRRGFRLLQIDVEKLHGRVARQVFQIAINRQCVVRVLPGLFGVKGPGALLLAIVVGAPVVAADWQACRGQR